MTATASTASSRPSSGLNLHPGFARPAPPSGLRPARTSIRATQRPHAEFTAARLGDGRVLNSPLAGEADMSADTVMSAAPAAPTTGAGVRRSRRDRAGRALMWLAALAAAGSAVAALFTVLDAGDADKVVETWRLSGLIVFAGLFALLALRPRQYRGVWELVIASKLALTITALGYVAHGGITGAGAIAGWDGGLTLVLITAYICCRGWRAGRCPR